MTNYNYEINRAENLLLKAMGLRGESRAGAIRLFEDTRARLGDEKYLNELMERIEPREGGER